MKIFNPYFFNKYSVKILPFLIFSTFVIITIGLYQALIVSPIDYQQGNMVRVMYIHVPAAWLALLIFVFIGMCSFIDLIWGVKLFYILSIAAAPIGAVFAFITLITGSLWGKPIWGAWWVWDACLTSMLILFLLYLTYISVVNSGDNIYRSQKPAAVIALLGLINIPIIKFSVDIWYSLHQKASIVKFSSPSIHISMLIPLTIMFIGFIFYFLTLLIMRVNIILKRIKNL